ncbi:sensor histidine kinase [Peristeroidobacter agariperforans]|uniref:sensor histidine kinase n=1 Tax=Peristeroidobacter agariperforans TaxID=268404 RepID=UPI0018E5917D|nr:ATP-binding protein [Peristeroidobacter agariperforans]
MKSAAKTWQSLRVRRAAVVMLIAAMIAGSGWLAYELALQSGFGSLQRTANDRLSLLQLTLDATIERFRYLPTALAQAAPIAAVYEHPESPQAREAANKYLKSLNEAAGSSDIYVLDHSGVALAASNYLDKHNFIGRNYAFRPYFTEALNNDEGRYYAVGATTGKPGYFLWHSANENAAHTGVGVAVVKVDLHPLQNEWKSTGALVAMLDPNGVIFLTSRPTWQYRPISHLSESQLRLLRDTRQYGRDIDDLNPLFVGERTDHGQKVVRINEPKEHTSHEYVVFSQPVPKHGWNMVVLFPLRAVQEQAAVVAAAVMLAVLAALLIYLVTHQRRHIVRAKLNAHHILEQRVTERTAELAATNSLLSAQINERIRTERDLRRAQDNLVHATKMASLGQALAGVAHEINQSLAAMTTYIAGARVLLDRNDKDSALSNLKLVSAIVTRMGALTQHLKTFARKDTESKQATDITAAIRYALSLVDYRVGEQDVTLHLSVPEQPVYVIGNAVRLEQVIVNLISNALDAMRERPQRQLTIELEREERRASLKVSDTGRGIAREHLSSVFDPFYTTKDVGQGLGLGLSISYGIIQDMGGEISVESTLDRGTTFRIVVPLAGILAPHTAVAIQT